MRTTLKYLANDPLHEWEKPYEMFGLTEVPENQRSNCQYMTIDGIQLLDVRDSNETFSLKDQGFKYVHHRSKCPLSADDFEKPGDALNPNVDAYLKETIAFVRNELGASQVICFDWRVGSDCNESNSVKIAN